MLNLFFRTFLFVSLVTLSPVQGTPWCITLEDGSDADGGNLTVVVTGDGNPPVIVTSGGNIPGGMTAETKAALLADVLNESAALQAMVDPDNPKKIKVEIQDDWANDDEITKIDFKDIKTGQKLNAVKDDPAGIVVDVRIDITGFGIDAASGATAEAVLAIGTGPLAAVPTLGRTGAQIEADLVSAFNSLYSPTYTAALAAGAVFVTGIPCEEGTVFGSDDNGITFQQIMTRTGQTALVPALPLAAVLILVGALLASAILIVRRHSVG